MGIRIITNNPEVYSKYSDVYKVELLDTDYLGVLFKVRDMIHLGFEMYTHPLSGSIKPNETPYKSIIISDNSKGLNFESLQTIESSIQTAEKFLKDRATPDWFEQSLNDFRLVDLSLIDNAVQIAEF